MGVISIVLCVHQFFSDHVIFPLNAKRPIALLLMFHVIKCRHLNPTSIRRHKTWGIVDELRVFCKFYIRVDSGLHHTLLSTITFWRSVFNHLLRGISLGYKFGWNWSDIRESPDWYLWRWRFVSFINVCDTCRASHSYHAIPYCSYCASQRWMK